MEKLPKRRIWLPSPGQLISLAIILMVAALAIPGLLSSNRASNERLASTGLKTLTSAEADFRANDRDGNHVEDFWTGDVSGLYYVTSPETKDAIKLIDEKLANADPKPVFPLPMGTMEREGYFYQALDRDDSVKGDKGLYKLDTDKSGRKVHNKAMFGFCSFPSSLSKGKYMFLVNENNTIIRIAIRDIQPRTAFPADEEWMSAGN